MISNTEIADKPHHIVVAADILERWYKRRTGEYMPCIEAVAGDLMKGYCVVVIHDEDGTSIGVTSKELP